MTNWLIKSLSFSGDGWGGAIYFYNGLNIKLFWIYVYGCSANTHYQFAYLRTNSNQILDIISINYCININGYSTLVVYNGNQNISHINISYNNNREESGIAHVNPNNMFTHYCTFYKNTVSSYICIYLHGNSGTISKSNIIFNNSPVNYGVIYVIGSGNYNLNECIFDKNQNILLYVNTGSLQLINCYYLTGSYSTSGSVINLLISTNTNYYLHSIYFTYYCSYSSDLIVNTPIPTISNCNYQIITFYCNNYQHLSLIIFFSFLIVEYYW